MPPSKLDNTHILIFGGSSGLGHTTASQILLTSSPSILTLVSSNPTKLAAAASRLPPSSTTIKTLTIDLSDLPNLRQNLLTLLDTATSNGLNKITHIIYTADGAAPLPPFPETEVADITAQLSMRAYAPLILASILRTHAHIEASADTSITFTNGSSSHRPMPGWAVADAAAGAMEGMVRGLTVDFAPVRVNLVSSGPVSTELFQTLPEETVELFRSKCLTGRIGRPEDVAEAYLYLMKDGNVTGTTLFTEGGRILAP
ncbi:Short-chain dehydrogenase/reductase ATR9 [Colletotrichum siamense]|uniref:Short-chain dehydrogenase/reductase ATR9 n=1 Tax=Colletotrichum siamense TaxID=690259 RepID=A0A9P5F3S9_COLSI|nr:Short-chain dehydrogenase/reductase ATR9 [Colletotrichum siamense]KAF4865385.1 Short-chain dehydrogenase/reductase ATR9 [Colletotrichum siamense]